jgi:hypothetical protein
LGSDEWFFPQVGIVDNSYQARLWKEPFAVHVGDKFSDVGLVWRGDVDVTAEMSFGGATPMDWLGGINATHAEIINVSVLYRGTPYVTLSGLAIQQECVGEACFDPLEDFWVLPIPTADGVVDEGTYRHLHAAASELGELEPLDADELLPLLGLRFSETPPTQQTS